LTLKECQEHAEKKGGKCLSTEYIDTGESMIWQCVLKHIWETPFRYLKYANSWCPKCDWNLSENVARSVFLTIYPEFYKARPSFLKNPETGYNLELDGYNAYYKVAFEYQGQQHDEYIPYFHKTEEKFKELQERDKLKVELCKLNDIDLIIIPCIYNHQTPKAMEDFIISELLKRELILVV
jgi:hypothetical protein